ncbi:MAG: YceD family protein [Eubacteriales bacterium]
MAPKSTLKVILMLQMNVARLKHSPGNSASFNLCEEIPPMEMQGEKVAFAGPVRAPLTAVNTGGALKVEGSASGSLRLTCGRCLEPFDLPFTVPVEEVYAFTAEKPPENAVAFTGDFIDVTPEVYNSILLAMPMKAVCREDCPGLCPRCGQKLADGPCGCGDDETDPRLAALKKLLQ